VAGPAFIQINSANSLNLPAINVAYWMSILMEMKGRTWGFRKITGILSWGKLLGSIVRFGKCDSKIFPPHPKIVEGSGTVG